jgi:hypothetical protein
MWSSMGFSLPGMVTPTLDTDELDKRIGDLKAVENWLKINLNMLQMTTQGLEVQRAALAAVKAMSQHAAAEAQQREAAADENPFSAAALWPWNLMQAQPAGDAPERDERAGTAQAPEREAQAPARRRARTSRKSPPTPRK